MNTLFTTFENSLDNDESLNFNIKRTEKGLEITVTPELISSNKKHNKTTDNIRANLAIPLFLIGSGEELDGEFEEMLSGYADARSQLKDSYQELLATIGAASNEAQNKKNEVKKPSKTASNKVSTAVESDNNAVSTQSNVPKPQHTSSQDEDSL